MENKIEQNLGRENAKVHTVDLDQTLTKIKTSLAMLDYFSAIELAQAGDLSAAESVLRRAIQQDPTEENLDLLARVLAQQERLDEAKGIWDQILLQNPDHSNARAALNAIESQKRKIRNKPLLAPVLGWLIPAIGLIILIGILFQLGSVTRSISQVDTLLNQQATALAAKEASSISSESIDQITSRINTEIDQRYEGTDNEIAAVNGLVKGLSTQIAALQNNIAQSPTATPQSKTADVHIDVPGIRLVDTDNSIQLTFEQGLFLYELVLSIQGKQLLTDLAYQLEPYVGQLEITVYGFTDDIERSVNYLDLQRALTVVKHITATSQIPEEMFVIRDAGDLPAPYSNSNLSNRMRNRTVMLVINQKP